MVMKPSTSCYVIKISREIGKCEGAFIESHIRLAKVIVSLPKSNQLVWNCILFDQYLFRAQAFAN